MKKILTFLLVISFSYASLALENPTFITEKEEASKSLKSSESNSSISMNEDDKKKSNKPLEVDSEISESQELESDSSYYSVNKFNILLYFVYKLKYGEDDEPVEE